VLQSVGVTVLQQPSLLRDRGLCFAKQSRCIFAIHRSSEGMFLDCKPEPYLQQRGLFALSHGRLKMLLSRSEMVNRQPMRYDRGFGAEPIGGSALAPRHEEFTRKEIRCKHSS